VSYLFVVHTLDLLRFLGSDRVLYFCLKMLRDGLLVSAVLVGVLILVDLRKTRLVDPRKLVLVIGLFFVASCAFLSEEIAESYLSGPGLGGVTTRFLSGAYSALILEGMLQGQWFSAVSGWAIRQSALCLGLGFTFAWSLMLTRGMTSRVKISELRFRIAKPAALFLLCASYAFMFPAALRLSSMLTQPTGDALLRVLREGLLVAGAAMLLLMCVAIIRDGGGKVSRVLGASAGLFCLFWGISFIAHSVILWDSFLGLVDMSHPLVYFRPLSVGPLILQGSSLISMFLILMVGAIRSAPHRSKPPYAHGIPNERDNRSQPVVL
jgi:hypothetical protein